jgi:hypothetical protein
MPHFARSHDCTVHVEHVPNRFAIQIRWLCPCFATPQYNFAFCSCFVLVSVIHGANPGRHNKANHQAVGCACSNGKGSRPHLSGGRSKRRWPSESVMQLETIWGEIRADARPSRAPAQGKSCSCNGPGSPRPRPTPCCKGCSTRSTGSTGYCRKKDAPPRPARAKL